MGHFPAGQSPLSQLSPEHLHLPVNKTVIGEQYDDDCKFVLYPATPRPATGDDKILKCSHPTSSKYAPDPAHLGVQEADLSLPSLKLDEHFLSNTEAHFNYELSQPLPGPYPDDGNQPKPTLLPEPSSEGCLPIYTVDDLPGQIPEAKADELCHSQPSDNNNSKPSMYNSCLFPDHAIWMAAERIKNLWPTPTPSAIKRYPEFCSLYTSIRQYNLSNFLGARIPLRSGLNIKNWYKYLSDFHDSVLCEFLQFGWPLGYNNQLPPESTNVNHPSANAHLKAVREFVDTELQYDALLGPFDEEPFQPWFQISPLMTRAKKGSSERRIIVDLSFPNGTSVNDGIDPTDHLGVNITYSLPTISDLVIQLQQHGKYAYIWKADLKRAYRQIRSDPLDAPFLGIRIGTETFIDRCPPFGCRSSASICQRMANGIVFIMAKENHQVTAYLMTLEGVIPPMN